MTTSRATDLTRVGIDLKRAATKRRVQRQSTHLGGQLKNAPRGSVKSKALGHDLRVLA